MAVIGIIQCIPALFEWLLFEAANPVFQAVLSAVSSRVCVRDKWSKLVSPNSVLQCVLWPIDQCTGYYQTLTCFCQICCVLWTALHLEMYNQKGAISDDEHYDFQTFHCCFDSNNIFFYAILIALYISDTNAEYCVYFMEKVLPGTAVTTLKKVSI